MHQTVHRKNEEVAEQLGTEAGIPRQFAQGVRSGLSHPYAKNSRFIIIM